MLAACGVAQHSRIAFPRGKCLCPGLSQLRALRLCRVRHQQTAPLARTRRLVRRRRAWTLTRITCELSFLGLFVFVTRQGIVVLASLPLWTFHAASVSTDRLTTPVALLVHWRVCIYGARCIGIACTVLRTLWQVFCDCIGGYVL